MDRDALKLLLAQGLSLEAIGERFDRHPSTVGYWVRKHGLVAAGAAKHAARGALPVDVLRERVEAGCSHRAIAKELGVSQSTVRHWLGRYGLVSRRAARLQLSAGARERQDPRATLECPRHGLVEHRLKTNGSYRCPRCTSEAVIRRRRRIKRILVEEAGGKCAVCGYDRYVGALEFHHLDPREKSFTIAHAGLTRSIAAARREAAKCVLLCGNCHSEVEGGIVTLPGARGLDEATVPG